MTEADSSAAPATSAFRVVTGPPTRFPKPDLRGVWLYRDLFYFLVRRDVAIVYKQTALGFGWAVLRPVALAGVYTAIFGVVLDVPSEGVPFAAFVVSGLILWLFFTQALTRSASSTVSAAGMISKVYFPRLTIPLAAAVPPLVDLAIGLVIVEAILLAYGINPQIEMLAVPLVIIVLGTLALGVGLILSALAARFRDVEIILSFALQPLLFASAVLYPVSLVPEEARALFSLNPLVGVMETFRAAMLPVDGLDLLQLVPSALIAIVLVIGGPFYFARAEQTIADVI